MKFQFFILTLVTVFVQIHCDWWESSSFYQIYPRSFKDSNGDGIGDLNGITSKLSYLKEIGVTATWLSPIFQSPMKDFGYDISNFFDIHAEYGTMADFESLLAAAKQIGIKIILDFVPNHSSDQNEWFKKSVNKEPGYEDFYVWHPGYPNPANVSSPLPPSNWLSAFRKSAWEWNSQRQEFYLHQFAIQQPDLNYRNDFVVSTMKSVLQFWLEKGVDGFRIDAVPWMFEVKPDAVTGRYPDEPPSGSTTDTEDPNYLRHIYTQDIDDTLDMVYQWRELLDKFKIEHGGDTKVILTEAHSTIDIVMKYYGDGNGRDGSHMPFNFQFMPNINSAPQNARDIERIVKIWMNNMPRGRVPNWVVGNHDQRRVASRFGENHIDAVNTLVQSLPGVAITYNGEEIGMTDVYISWENTVDPAACNSNPTIFDTLSRDPARTPFQWDDTTNAGFSTAAQTWLPISANYRTINVKTENADPNSHLSKYKALAALRQNPAYKYGSASVIALNDDVLSIIRYAQIQLPYYMILINYGHTKQTVTMNAVKARHPTGNATVTIAADFSKHRNKRSLNLNKIVLDPYESIVLELKN